MPNKKKLNCWEKSDCGREPGGSRTSWLGVCQTAMAMQHDNLNDGDKGGRICWAVEGSFKAFGKPSCVFIGRYHSCANCPTFKGIQEEQGEKFVLLPPDHGKKEAA